MEGAPRVSFGEAVKKGLGGYCDYKSRSRRSEYWFWFLFAFLVGLCVGIIGGVLTAITGTPVIQSALTGLFSLAELFFTLPLAVRRLHDIGKSGWFLLLGLIPFVGFIIMLYFVLQDSQREQNQWGPSPKYGGNTDGFLPSETV